MTTPGYRYCYFCPDWSHFCSDRFDDYWDAAEGAIVSVQRGETIGEAWVWTYEQVSKISSMTDLIATVRAPADDYAALLDDDVIYEKLKDVLFYNEDICPEDYDSPEDYVNAAWDDYEAAGCLEFFDIREDPGIYVSTQPIPAVVTHAAFRRALLEVYKEEIA